ncbi:hypothetical protein L1987_38895 [Smallanthus sonchifolius]|uniref:Uncharacterized protein n=1 Tax=Smallanthus sonchifolius TaxID=185202 RepID=A0ACB9HKA1_9ASTR|nr:hypothetical protein L1987_38895 [Smallanthus sonchifolius]
MDFASSRQSMFQPVLTSTFVTSPSNPSSPPHHSHSLQIIYGSDHNHLINNPTREKAKDFLEREKGAITGRKGFVFLSSLRLNLLSLTITPSILTYSPVDPPIRLFILI